MRIGRVRHACVSARTYRGAGEGFRGHRSEVVVFGAARLALWLLGRYESRCLKKSGKSFGSAFCAFSAFCRAAVHPPLHNEGRAVASSYDAGGVRDGVHAGVSAGRVSACGDEGDRGDAVAGGSGATHFTKRGVSGSSVSLRARGVVRRRVITQRGRR